jgi:hypothetical protein
MPDVELACITIDCADPARVARFWNEALRWDGVALTPDEGNATCATAGHPYLEFVRVADHKTVKNRLHLGCVVDSMNDLDSEIERLLSLGATFAWEEELPPRIASHFRNVILQDPEGNEFCVGGGSSDA